jgi:hypothetical protein
MVETFLAFLVPIQLVPLRVGRPVVTLRYLVVHFAENVFNNKDRMEKLH